MRRLAAGLQVLLPTVLGLSLLGVGTAARLGPGGEEFWRRQPKRFWEDLYVAVGHHLHGQFPVRYDAVTKFRDEQGVIRYVERHGDIRKLTLRSEIRPWQFWRTIPSKRLLEREPITPFPRYDDAGRPLLMSLLFGALGGVAPYLLFWLGGLVSAPLLLWLSWELVRSGRTTAALVLALLLGGSGFVVDALALAYSPAGFYVGGAILLLAFAVYGGSGTVTPRGLFLRVLAGGGLFAVFALCRGGCLLLLPGFAFGLAMAARRSTAPAGAGARLRWPVATLLGLVLFLLPYGLARAGLTRLVQRTWAELGQGGPVPQQHAFWFGIWTGLGDFDRTKGYEWLDSAASAAAVAHGGTPMTATVYDPANEAILRRLILGDILKDPLWYVGILTKRAWATLTQAKLWPWGPAGGVSIAPAAHPNEAAIDHYYSLTAPGDVFGVGGWRVEVPVPFLLAPAWALAILALRRRPADDPAAARRRGEATALLCTALGTLPLPILVTTAGAIETQAFFLVYYLGLALIVEDLARRLFARRPVRPEPASDGGPQS